MMTCSFWEDVRQIQLNPGKYLSGMLVVGTININWKSLFRKIIFEKIYFKGKLFLGNEN